jgi:hypothetical protein
VQPCPSVGERYRIERARTMTDDGPSDCLLTIREVPTIGTRRARGDLWKCPYGTGASRAGVPGDFPNNSTRYLHDNRQYVPRLRQSGWGLLAERFDSWSSRLSTAHAGFAMLMTNPSLIRVWDCGELADSGFWALGCDLNPRGHFRQRRRSRKLAVVCFLVPLFASRCTVPG